jgi:hypothetical protein
MSKFLEVWGFYFDPGSVPTWFASYSLLGVVGRMIATSSDPAVTRFWSAQSCSDTSYFI